MNIKKAASVNSLSKCPLKEEKLEQERFFLFILIPMTGMYQYLPMYGQSCNLWIRKKVPDIWDRQLLRKK